MSEADSTVVQEVQEQKKEGNVEKKRPRYASTSEGGKVVNIDVLEPFFGHPFIIPNNSDDPEMKQLMTSIEQQGLLNAPIVRLSPRDKNKYEIISGHRRVEACKLNNYKEIIIKEVSMDNNEATAFMISSNVHRLAKVSFFERVRACNMMNEVMNGHKELVGNIFGITVPMVQKYINLNILSDELLKLIDNKKFLFSAAVEIVKIVKGRKKNDKTPESLKIKKLHEVEKSLIEILKKNNISITPAKAKKIVERVALITDIKEITPELLISTISTATTRRGNVMISLNELESYFGDKITTSEAKTKIIENLKEHFPQSNNQENNN